jgi:hypothetical protein
MNKKLLEKFQLEAGGSHYPSVHTELQLKFARQLIKECINAVENTDTRHAITTFDKGLIDATIARSIASIRERFDFHEN